MRRVAAPIVAIAGCSFSPGMLTSGDPPRDADPDSVPDVVPDAGPATCDANAPQLVACYRFEGSTQDASNHALHATQIDVTFVPGRVGMAMQLSATGAADVAETPILDVPMLTVEAWIRPDALPATGQRMGILDNGGQYGLFLHDTGNLRCIASNTVNQTNASITPGQWHHVACTHDGSTTTLYVDGAVAGQATGGSPLGSGGTTGMSIAADNPPGSGQRLAGLIDELHIYKSARSAAEICEDAGTCSP